MTGWRRMAGRERGQPPVRTWAAARAAASGEEVDGSRTDGSEPVELSVTQAGTSGRSNPRSISRAQHADVRRRFAVAGDAEGDVAVGGKDRRTEPPSGTNGHACITRLPPTRSGCCGPGGDRVHGPVAYLLRTPSGNASIAGAKPAQCGQPLRGDYLTSGPQRRHPRRIDSWDDDPRRYVWTKAPNQSSNRSRPTATELTHSRH